MEPNKDRGVRFAAIAKEIQTESPTIEAVERESENLKLAIEQTQQ